MNGSGFATSNRAVKGYPVPADHSDHPEMLPPDTCNVSSQSRIILGQLEDALGKAESIISRISCQPCAAGLKPKNEQEDIVTTLTRCRDTASQLHQVLDSLANVVGN